MDCGCEARKDVMFVRGNPGMDCLVILAIPVLVFLLAKAVR